MRRTRLAPPRPRPLFWSLAAMALAGCATLGDREPPLVPTRHVIRSGPYAVYSNVPIAADAPAIRGLKSIEDDVEASLGIRARADVVPVEVYILDDRESFTHFLRFYYPDLPPRRAFFVSQGTQRAVYTYFGDRLGEDMRHEATHALLNVAVGDLPLWLDEGLAEYFEGPENRHGKNPEHLERLPGDLASGWRPDLARLETLKSVREMTPTDYREAWAWVHYLLKGSNEGKTVLLRYLADLRTKPGGPPLSALLKNDGLESGSRMLAHIDRVRALPDAAPAAPVATATPAPAPTFRLQDGSAEPVRAGTGARGGLLGRLRSWVGY